jgi:hypothetical protein
MYRLKCSYLPEPRTYLNQLFNLPTRATESIFQASARTYFVEKGRTAWRARLNIQTSSSSGG